MPALFCARFTGRNLTPEEHALKSKLDVPRWQKTLLLPALLFYASLLVLGSWREEIRPAFLDRASIVASHWLACAGVVAGQGVFSSGSEEAPLITAQSVFARGLDRQGRRIDLGPGPDHPPRGLLLFSSQEKVLLTRLLMNLETLRNREQQGRAYRGPAKMRRLARTLVQHFRGRARAQDRNITELQLLWTLHGVDPDTGKGRTQDMLVLHWRDGDDGSFEPRWFPPASDPVVRALRPVP